MKVTDFLKGKFKYDNMGQYIWLVEPNGNHQKIADIRGWGRIQHFFMNKKGKLDEKAAEAFQDECGQWVVDALNKALESQPDQFPDVELRKELENFLAFYCNLWESEKHRINTEIINEYLKSRPDSKDVTDYKAKYEKCISVIKKFDAGIIGMYDL